MNTRLSILAFFFFLLSTCVALAQTTGSVTGTIYDAETGDPMIGANVILVGTSYGSSTDLEGKYIIRNVPPGTYTVRISFIGYTPLQITNLSVRTGQPAMLNSTLKPESFQTEEVIVSAQAVQNTEASILAQRRKAMTIGDGISAEQIRRSPDATSSDALKRVTGISLMDNKFIFVRGTSERYSNAVLNDVILPSTETDRKAFSFDILPSNLIDNTIVTKSFSPEAPGDVSGGLVKINTIDFPQEPVVELSLSGSYEPRSTGKEFMTYRGGAKDWLGMDDGTRAMPDLPANITSGGYTADQMNDYAKLFKNNWSTSRSLAPYNHGIGLTIGNSYDLLGNPFGFVTALSYKRNYSTTRLERNEYESSGEPRFSYTGTESATSILIGGLMNLSYKAGPNHKLTFKNTFSRSSDDEVIAMRGFQYSDAGSEQIQSALRFISRSVFSSQLAGDHFMGILGDLKMNWQISYSESQRDEPDYRRIYYGREIGSGDPFSAVLGFQANLKNGGRFFSDLSEQATGAGMDFMYPTSVAKIRFGMKYDRRDRDFNSRLFGMVINAPGNGYTDFQMMYLPIEEIFSEDNFKRNGFSISEYENGSNNYSAASNVVAGYAMAEIPLSIAQYNDLVIAAGARFEDAALSVDSRDLSNQYPVSFKNENADLLPSVNVTYKFTEATNIRAAYGKTINRPELRELAPFAYYDFQTQTSLRGNENLRRAVIHSYDIRFETFPAIGELFSVGLFYKDLTDAIEKVVIAGNALGSERTFRNSESAHTVGVEFETRMSLESIWNDLPNVIVTLNYALIRSEVDLKGSETTIAREKRPLQGQSPYTLNAGFAYTLPQTATSLSLLYNRIGERIVEVSTQYEEDIIEMPRDVIDIVASQPLTDDIRLKFTAKDILQVDQVFRQGDKTARVNSRDASYSLSLSLRI